MRGRRFALKRKKPGVRVEPERSREESRPVRPARPARPGAAEERMGM